MKRLVLILFMVLGCISIADAATKKITLSFSPGDFIKEKDSEGRIYIVSTKWSSGFDKDTSTPALPMIPIYVYIDRGKDFKSLSYTVNSECVEANVVMAANPATCMGNTPSVEKEIHKVLFAKKVYPETNVTYTGTHYQDNHQFLCFSVCPYIYDADDNNLKLITSLDLEIELMESVLDRKAANQYRESQNLSLIKKLVINPEDIRANHFISQVNLRSTNDVDYVIVTTQALASAFQPLVTWKSLKGIKAEIVTMEYINSHYSGSTAQLRLKSCLQDYHQNRNLQYALLGGDDSVVPVQYAHCETNVLDANFNTVRKESDIPADIFYMNFQYPFDWYSETNSGIGKPEDGVDFTPEIYVTRVPVRNTYDAFTFVNKVLNYERNPPVESWNNSILTMGCTIDKILNYNYDIRPRGDYIYNSYISPYWNGDRVRYYDSDHSEWKITADSIQFYLEEGHSFVEMLSHGVDTCWQLNGYHPYYGNTYASTLNNSCPTLISTVACLTNAFDRDLYPCLSECFIRNEYSGIIAYLGNSREGLLWFGSVGGPSISYEAQYYKALFNGDIPERNYGKVVGLGKAYWIISANTNEDYRWIMCGLNPIGDPEMPVFVSRPQRFSCVSYTLQNDSLVVSTGTDSCRVCVMSTSDGGASYYQVQNLVSTAQFEQPTMDCSICVTRPGYVPYIMEYKDTIYIQNESLNGNNIFSARNVVIGRDVTTTNPQGPVEIESGSTIIKAKNVTIKNSFEVTLGAELKIEQ